MAEKIKYPSLIRFIKEDIVEDRIPTAFRNKDFNMRGGSSSTSTSTAADSTSNALTKVAEGVKGSWSTLFSGIKNFSGNSANWLVETAKQLGGKIDWANYNVQLATYGTIAVLVISGSGYTYKKRIERAAKDEEIKKLKETNASAAAEEEKKVAIERAAEDAKKKILKYIFDDTCLPFKKELETKFKLFEMEKETQLEDWLTKSTSAEEPLIDSRLISISLLGYGRKLLTEELIYYYVKSNYDENVQKENETNGDYYIRVVEGLEKAQEKNNKIIDSPDLFKQFTIAKGNISSIDTYIANVSLFVNEFKIPQDGLARAFIQFIQKYKLPCLSLTPITNKLIHYTFENMKIQMNEFIRDQDMTLIKSSENVKELISKFVLFLYNKTMRLMLQESFKKSYLLTAINEAITNNTNVEDFKGYEIKFEDANYPTSMATESSAPYLEYLQKLAYNEWLTSYLVSIKAIDLNIGNKTVVNSAQQTIYSIISIMLSKDSKTKPDVTMKSITNDYELYLCSSYQSFLHRKDIDSKLTELGQKDAVNKSFDSDVAKTITTFMTELDKYFMVAEPQRMCVFNETIELQQREKMNFNIGNHVYTTTVVEEVALKSAVEVEGTKTKEGTKSGEVSTTEFMARRYVRDQEQTNQTDKSTSSMKTAVKILLAVLCFFGYYYYYTTTTLKQKINVSNVSILLKIVLTTLASIGIYKSGIGDSAIAWMREKIGFSMEGGSSLYDKATDALSSAATFVKDNAISAVTNLFSTRILIDRLGFSQTMSNAFIGLGSLIVAIGGVVALKRLFYDAASENIQENIAALEESVRSGRTYSKEAGRFNFNPNTGKIELVTGFRPPSKYHIKISQGSHFGIDNIYMQINTDGRITYIVNGDIEIDAISYIENKPVQTALVLAYLIKDKHFSHLTTKSSTTTIGEPENYKFHFEDDGTLILTKKENNVDKEVESVSMVLRQQMTNDSKELAQAAENKKQVCKNLFGKEESEHCTKHFNSILGKAGLNMLQNLGKAITTTSIINALNNAEVNVQYEILKNLDWKMKLSNGKKTMVSVDEWVNRLKSETKPAIVKYGESYEKFFNNEPSGSEIKSLLDNMVNRINNNSRLLQEKYQEAVQQTTTSTRRKRTRLSTKKIAELRSQSMTENNILNTPFPIPGRPGALGYALQPLIGGGDNNSFFSDKYKQAFDTIKRSLSGYNQKLSSNTQSEIESKLKKIEELETDLSNLHKKINKYTQILKTEKNARIGRNVSEEDIDDLINQYATNSKKQSRYIATITTAFGKIRMLLDKQEMGESMNQEKTYYSNL